MAKPKVNPDQFGRQAVPDYRYDTVTIPSTGLGTLGASAANLSVFTGDNVGKPWLTNQKSKTGLIQQDEELKIVGISATLHFPALVQDVTDSTAIFQCLKDAALVLNYCAFQFQIGSTPYGPFPLHVLGNAGGVWAALAAGVSDTTAATLHKVIASAIQNGAPSPMGYWKWGHYILMPGNQPFTAEIVGATGALNNSSGVTVRLGIHSEPYLRNVRPETGLRVRA